MLDLNYLEGIFKLFNDSKADEFELRYEDVKLRMAKNKPEKSDIQYVQMQPPSFPTQTIATNIVTPSEPEQAKPTEADDSAGLHTINSPMVGTFYRAPSPDSDAFVETGSRVSPVTTLCILEAMKLMNEIECDISGIVVKILAQNAQPVDFNQPLFLIKPD